MNKLEIIKDAEDKEHLVFTDSDFDEEKSIGDKLEDFEILMLLGEGAFGKVLKVRSKLDNNIYAMKIADLQKIEKEQDKHAKELAATREVSFLPKLSHPHIIKYYNSFEKEPYKYIITEYIRNGDLCDLIDIHRELKQHFKEEDLWNIFYQCMDSLSYIHQAGIIHRDIKPLNIFIDDNMKVKIGDFGISALNPSQFKTDKFTYTNSYFVNEIEQLSSHDTCVGTSGFQAAEMMVKKGQYDQKIDVYAMGNTFFELLYLHSPLINSEEDKKLKYSETIKNIIYLMRQEDKNKRLSSQEAFDLIKKEYLKISKNSSIFSLITCLNSFKEFNDRLKKIKIPNYSSKIIGKNEKIERLTNSYLGFLVFLNREEKAENEWELNINIFRNNLIKLDLKFEGINEIKPSFLFTYIIEKIYEEVKPKNQAKRFCGDGFHLINSVDDNEKRNEGEARTNFDNYFEKRNSPVIEYFKGLIKQTNICNKCKFKTYSFIGYFFANFDLHEISKKKEITIFDLEENFKSGNDFVKVLYCDKCYEKYEHKCTKEYYTFPKLLVISIKRGIKTINQTEVNLKEFIELKDLDKNKDNLKKYQLVGLIKKISKTEEKEEQYYSNFYINNQWFTYDKNKKIYKSHPPFEKSKSSNKKGIYGGDIVMLFYILKTE